MFFRGLDWQRPQDPHKLIRRGRRVIRTAFNHPRTSPADPLFYRSELEGCGGIGAWGPWMVASRATMEWGSVGCVRVGVWLVETWSLGSSPRAGKRSDVWFRYDSIYCFPQAALHLPIRGLCLIESGNDPGSACARGALVRDNSGRGIGVAPRRHVGSDQLFQTSICLSFFKLMSPDRHDASKMRVVLAKATSMFS